MIANPDNTEQSAAQSAAKKTQTAAIYLGQTLCDAGLDLIGAILIDHQSQVANTVIRDVARIMALPKSGFTRTQLGNAIRDDATTAQLIALDDYQKDLQARLLQTVLSDRSTPPAPPAPQPMAQSGQNQPCQQRCCCCCPCHRQNHANHFPPSPPIIPD